MNLSAADSFETPCKFCNFAQWDGNDQIGCAAGRLELFKPESVIQATDGEFNFSVVKEFCTSYRTKEWNGGDANVKKMQQENALSFSLIFYVDEFSKNDFEILNYNIEKINYISSKIQFILVHSKRFPLSGTKDVVKLTNTISDCGFTYTIVECLFDDDESIEETMTHVIKKINKSFYCVYNTPAFSEYPLIVMNGIVNSYYKKATVFEMDNLYFVNSTAMKKYYFSDYDTSLAAIIEQSKNQDMYWKI